MSGSGASLSFGGRADVLSGSGASLSFGGRADVLSGSEATLFPSEAEPTFARERSEPFVRATRVNERSELILFLILNLPLTLLLHLILTLLLHLLFPTPSIVSPFLFQNAIFAC